MSKYASIQKEFIINHVFTYHHKLKIYGYSVNLLLEELLEWDCHLEMISDNCIMFIFNSFLSILSTNEHLYLEDINVLMYKLTLVDAWKSISMSKLSI